MPKITHTGTVYDAARAEWIAHELARGEKDGWTYEVVYSTGDGRRGVVAVFDETGTLVGYWGGP